MTTPSPRDVIEAALRAVHPSDDYCEIAEAIGARLSTASYLVIERSLVEEAARALTDLADDANAFWPDALIARLRERLGDSGSKA